MTFKLSVDGKEVEKTFKDVKKIITDNINKTFFQVGLYTEGKVKESIAGRSDEPRSVDTGRLLNSVKHEVLKDGVRVYTNVEYASHIEYGTSKMEGRHHFTNTLAREKDKINKYIKDSLKEI